MSTDQPISAVKAQLIEGAVDVFVERGLSDLSLRELASALGTSHRMLIYHFGSKEALLTEVVRATERRQQLVLAQLTEGLGGDSVEVARTFWRRLRSPELAPLERLFFEVYAQALQGKAYASTFLDDAVRSWVEMTVPALRAEGLSETEARSEARLGQAVVRGMLLDVLATGDRDGADLAFERFLRGTARLRVADPGV